MNREDKASIVEELGEKFANAKIAVVTDYRGMTVPVFEELRQELRKSNAEIAAAKFVDRFVISRLLTAKVIARNSNHHQAAGAVLFPEPLQFFVLRRVTTF